MDTPRRIETDARKERFTQRLRRRRQELEELLAEQQACLEELEAALRQWQSTDSSPQAAQNVDFRRRYELALDELRKLEAENDDLRRQLAERRATRPTENSPTLNASFYWEAEKRRLLTMLDNESEAAAHQTGAHASEQTTIDSEITSSEKEAALYKQNERDQQAHVTPQPEQPATLPADFETFLQAERERLLQLQNEWQEKLRHAEVELSLERAKLARERAELEERRRAVPAGEKTNPPSDADCSCSSRRRQWLLRLGLIESEPKEKPAR